MSDPDELARFRRLRTTHDPLLRNELTLAYLPLVRSIARRYRPPEGWQMQDVEQEGTLGLLRAVDSYAPDGKHKGIRFAAVAHWCIRKAISEAILDAVAEQPTVQLQAVERTHSSYSPQFTPTWLQDRVTRPLPLVEIASPAPDMSEQVALSATLEAALLLLSAQQRTVIERRFGLSGDGVVWTQTEIGRFLGVSQQRVSRVQAAALAALRRELAGSQEGQHTLKRLDAVGSRRARTRVAAA